LDVAALPEAELTIEEARFVTGKELFQTFMYVLAGKG
jgi:hypothetical protein